MKGWTSRIAALLTVGAVLLGAAPFSTSAQTRAGLTVSTGLEAAALADYLLSAPLASTEGSAVATCSDKCQIRNLFRCGRADRAGRGVILSTGETPRPILIRETLPARGFPLYRTSPTATSPVSTAVPPPRTRPSWNSSLSPPATCSTFSMFSPPANSSRMNRITTCSASLSTVKTSPCFPTGAR